MNRVTLDMRTILITVIAAALVAAALASASTAAPTAKTARTGTFLGRTTQDLKLTEEPWSVLISVTALRGHLVSVATTVRTECPGPEIDDIRVLKYFGTNGPRLTASGGFAIRVSGVSITGSIGAARASGHFSAIGGGCSGRGSWTAGRRL